MCTDLSIYVEQIFFYTIFLDVETLNVVLTSLYSRVSFIYLSILCVASACSFA